MSKLRIAVVYDNTVRPDTTGVYCRRALACLADVVHFNPATIGQASSQDFDLFLQIDDGLRYEMPSHLRPAAWWAIDTHLDLAWYLARARSFDYIFTAQRDAVQPISQVGGQVQWLPLACDPAFHRKHNTEKTWDITFIGNIAGGIREDLLRILASEFPNHLVDQRFFDEMALAYSRSRIVFNRSIRNDVNMRVFEGAASGSLLLTNELADDGLAELFESGKHLETYACADELVEKVRFYLIHESARERIAAAGRQRAYQYHTYRCRMQSILSAIIPDGTTSISMSQQLPFRPKAEASDLTSIVIPTHNQIEFTRQCLDAIRENTECPYEIIVVDNGSTDGTVAYLEDSPDVVLVCNRENRGFAVASNQGMRLARGSHILLLNNDTIVPKGWLRRLLRHLRGKGVGLVGPRSNSVSGPQEISATYGTLDELDSFAEGLAQQFAGQALDCNRLVGFCLLISRQALENVGFLDEQFEVGCFEDDDYTLRARLKGFRTVIAMDAFVHHFGGQTFRGANLDYATIMQDNEERFRAKWSGSAAGQNVTNEDDGLPPPDVEKAGTVSVVDPSRSHDVLLLAHFGLLRERLDRTQFLRYETLRRRGVKVLGPGIDGYREGMTTEEAIQLACAGKRPAWIIHGLDPKNSGIPLVSDLDRCAIPVAYEFGDSWADPRRQAQFINRNRFQLAFSFATRDLPYYQRACPKTEIIFLPNSVDTSIFRPRGEEKINDVLVYGALNPEYYPLRSRIAKALLNQSRLRVLHIPHPDYYPEGGWANENVVAGERLSRAISQSWIAIATQGRMGCLFMKYLEIAAAGATIAGDMPMDGRPFFGDCFIDLSSAESDAELIERLEVALADKSSLQKMAAHNQGVILAELSTDHFANRLLELLEERRKPIRTGGRKESPGDYLPLQNPSPREAAISAGKSDCEKEAHSIQRLFTWPERRPEFRSLNVIEGWLGDGAQAALRATLNSSTRIVVELGSWLGLSTRFIADLAPKAQVIAIDHFEGSPEHKSDAHLSRMLPELFNGFLSSCWDYRDRITPLRASTTDGLRILHEHGIRPDVIYVDAGHEYESVKADIVLARELFPAAILVGDDLPAPGVRQAVEEAAALYNLKFESFGDAWSAWRLIAQREPLNPNDASRFSGVGKLSLCMIVRDNENTIDACLAGIRPWVDEMIVIDTGSLDSTPHIAARHGAKVLHYPWPDSFAEARNESLRHATCEWIFWMDSDDTISPESGRKLRDLVHLQHADDVLGFVMQVHCPCSSDDGDQDATVVDHVKVFRNRSDLRFEGRIHEQIMPAIRRAGGDVEWSDVFVTHSGADTTPSGRHAKHVRDLRLLRLEERDNPASSFVQFNLGMTFADMDDHLHAVESLERSISLSQPSESHLRKAYALLVASLFQLERLDEASQVCEAGLRLFPADVELLFRKGFLAHHSGKLYEAAAAYLETLGTTEPAHFSSIDRGLGGYKTRHNLAIVYEDQTQHRLAEEQWRLVLKEVPRYRPAWRGLVGNLIAQEKHDQAMHELSQFALSGGRKADYFRLLAQVQIATKSVGQAMNSLEAALKLDPGDSETLDELCALLFQYGNPEATEIRLRELIALAPDKATHWQNLGSTYLRLKKLEPAIECFKTAISLNNVGARSHLYLGMALEQLGKITEAKGAWALALSIDSGETDVREEAAYRLGLQLR